MYKTARTRSTYFELFSKVRRSMSDLNLVFNPDVIVTDFEAAVIEATRQQFPQARQVGCFFHFGQAIWRKVQDLGLAARYKSDVELQLHIKSHIALAFLPTVDVTSFSQNLHTKFLSDPQVVDFHHYFKSTWLDGLFPILLWNQYNVDSIRRTNNAVESWHARFNRMVRTVHPNIFVLISHLQRENVNTLTVIDQAKLGFPPASRRSKYDRLHERIQKLYDDHRSGLISSSELLIQARHVIHVFE